LRSLHFKWLLVSAAVVSGCIHLFSCVGYGAYRHEVQLFFMFFTGASLYVLRHRIEMSWWLFCMMAGVLVVSMLERLWFSMVLALTLPYLLFFLAYVPSGGIRKYNKVGDYSYGLYIYAFPVQQVVVAYRPDVSVGGMIAWSTLIVLPLAIASWHLIEKPAMNWKYRFSGA